jgi:hypothetical protein
VPLASLSGGPVTIYVRLKSGMQPGGTGTVSRTITISSTGATTTTAVLGSGYITGLQITGSSPTSTYVIGAGPGDEKSFTVIGACLETTTQVSLAFGSNIEITTTAGNYTTPITSPVSLVITPGAIPSPKITTATYYYRLKSGLAIGTYADATTKVSLSADGTSSLTGAFTTKELQVTGTVLDHITVSSPVSTALYYAQGVGPSSERTFNVSGSGLTADIDVTPGANIEISTFTGTGFVSTPIILTQTAGLVASTPIYARLIAGLSAATYNDATTLVTASSTGFTSKTVQFVGTVDLGTGLSNKDISNVKCIAANGTIIVNGVEAGKQIDIYNNVGQKVKSVIATANNNIALSGKGLYVVKVDAFVQKVVLK